MGKSFLKNGDGSLAIFLQFDKTMNTVFQTFLHKNCKLCTNVNTINTKLNGFIYILQI